MKVGVRGGEDGGEGGEGEEGGDEGGESHGEEQLLKRVSVGERGPRSARDRTTGRAEGRRRPRRGGDGRRRRRRGRWGESTRQGRKKTKAKVPCRWRGDDERLGC